MRALTVSGVSAENEGRNTERPVVHQSGFILRGADMIGYPGIYLKTGQDSPGSCGCENGWVARRVRQRRRDGEQDLAGWRDGGYGRWWAHCSSGRSPRRTA